ncbi:MAG: membrane protein insertion efficiency factor YidD, partial [Micrococcaceae bacterium]|nr:membrane protein insertion efficiency factor YidD [Micrococcaceae bacterium]
MRLAEVPSDAGPGPLRWLWDLPRNLLILLIMGYRKAISPLYGDVCRYFPSCSA